MTSGKKSGCDPLQFGLDECAELRCQIFLLFLKPIFCEFLLAAGVLYAEIGQCGAPFPARASVPSHGRRIWALQKSRMDFAWDMDLRASLSVK